MHLVARLFLAALCIACTFSAASSAHAALRLNEVLAGPATDWNGSGAFSSRDDEWVEVVNDGVTAIDLSSYFLTDGSGTPRYRFSGMLGPSTHRVVFGSDAYDWERSTGFPAFGLSLGNSGDEAQLWQIAGDDTLLIDSVAWSSHTAAPDRALGRVPDATGAWGLLDGLNPYTGSLDPQGTGCSPSPGAANDCSSTPTRNTTWGRIKAGYR